MKIKACCYHHGFPDNQQHAENVSRDAKCKLAKHFAFEVLRQLSALVHHSSHLFNDDKIVPGQDEAVSRDVQSRPGVACSVTSLFAAKTADITHSSSLLQQWKQQHRKKVPDKSVGKEPAPSCRFLLRKDCSLQQIEL